MGDTTRITFAIWDVPWFTDLSMAARNLVWGLLTSGPAKRICPGLWHGDHQLMAAASKMPSDEAWTSLNELITKKCVEYDRRLTVLRFCELPDAAERPTSWKALKGMWNGFITVPKCNVRDRYVMNMKWLVEKGGSVKQHEGMQDMWNQTFGTIVVPNESHSTISLLDSDTSTEHQTSLFANSMKPNVIAMTRVTVSIPLGSGQDPERDQDQDPVLDQGPDLSPESPPARTNVIPFVMPPPLDERDRIRADLVNEIGYDHAMRFARVRSQIGSSAWGPHVNDSHDELRALVRSFSSLDDVKPRLLHALAVREAEAIAENTMKYFGGQMWKRANFDNAIAREVADVDRSRDLPGKGSTGREATGLSAIMESLADDDEDEAEKAGQR